MAVPWARTSGLDNTSNEASGEAALNYFFVSIYYLIICD